MAIMGCAHHCLVFGPTTALFYHITNVRHTQWSGAAGVAGDSSR